MGLVTVHTNRGDTICDDAVAANGGENMSGSQNLINFQFPFLSHFFRRQPGSIFRRISVHPTSSAGGICSFSPGFSCSTGDYHHLSSPQSPTNFSTGEGDFSNLRLLEPPHQRHCCRLSPSMLTVSGDIHRLRRTSPLAPLF
ncbi:unnamed protein product [Lactuca saligna]|uniref:Uncharacterized protein n=1 Tax=Lactuca saligna TaxID=75948 RepID=A0AA35Y4V5_LACSI|nr:unnamed protein product [Lactuca saligna]